MFSLLKKTAKYTLITGLVVGGTAAAAVAVMGDHRARAVGHHLHEQVLDRIDRSIDEPHKLRAQIQELRSEYPERIAQVRGDLGELDEELRQLQREQAISERVVELADADLEDLEAQLAAVRNGEGGVQLTAALTTSSGILSYDRAVARRDQIQGTRSTYANRAADAEYSMTYLAQQRQRLADLLTRLETERAELDTQVQSLTRQIEAIERNERIIDQLERYQDTFADCDAFEAASLEALTSHVATIRSRQEAELDVLSKSEDRKSYEDVARMQLDQESHDGAEDLEIEARMLVPQR